MTQYEVKVKTKSIATLDIEAQNPEQAKNIAEDIVNEDDFELVMENLSLKVIQTSDNEEE